MTRIKSPAHILLVALALGWSVDLLFYGKALGISMFLFVLSLMVALFGLGRLEGVRPVQHNLWLLVPLILFASMVFVRANPFVTFLNVVASLALLGLVAHFYAAGHPQRLGLMGYPIVLLRRLYRQAKPGPLPGHRQTGRPLPDPTVRRCRARTGAGRGAGNWRRAGGAE